MSTKPTLLSVAAASEFLIQSAQPITEIEQVDTLAANGRVLAVPQLAQINVPGMDNSQMDGYAVRSADCHEGVRLRVSQRIPAGHVGSALEPATAARIFTGAMVPQGADAIIMQEACETEGDYVILRQTPRAGEWIRRIGEDITSGTTILSAGVRLRPQELGLAASVGLASLPVLRKLRVAVFFTGDELIMPGQPLAPGAIYNSNRFLLRGLLENLGCEVSDYGIVPDQLQATRETLRAAAAQHDLIITSGGVSVGEEDHIKSAVEAEGKLNLWQIAMKPGKPLAFGEINHISAGTAGKTFFFGLPGNPVSTFVTFLIFVRPFLLRLQGVQQVAPRVLIMRADFNWPKADRRQEFLRVRINADGGLDLFPQQGSGVLTSTVWADGLIDNPAGKTIAVGDLVCFLPFDYLLN